MNFLDQQLTQISKRLIEIDLPELHLASGKSINVSNDILPGATYYQYYRLTPLGQAKLMLPGATDIPTLSYYQEAEQVEVYPIKMAFEYTKDDLLAAEFSGLSLDRRAPEDCRNAIFFELDRIAWTGHDQANITGLASDPNVTSLVFQANGNQNGGTNSTKWEHKTEEQIFKDLNDLAAVVPSQTFNTFYPKVLALPPQQTKLLSQRYYPAGTTQTIAEAFLKSQALFNGVNKIVHIHSLQGIGANGTDLALVYPGKVPNTASNYMSLHIPKQGGFRLGDMELRDEKMKFPCTLKTAGVEIVQNLYLAYGVGL